MNGRLYDPVVGRFLSPDPFIADPSFSQSYNRYAYALNNPLKYIDPSGEFIWQWLMAMAGNYLFGVADNTINKGMPLQQAFKTTPIVAGVNFSPGNFNQKYNYGISNNQVNAFNFQKQYDKFNETINSVIGWTKDNYNYAQCFINDGIWTLGVSGTASAGYGASFDLGVMMDFRDGASFGWYFSLEETFGADLSIGGVLNYYKPDKGTTINFSDLKGWGESFNGAALIFDGVYGGNSIKPGLHPETLGGYFKSYQNYGFGMSTGMPLGLTIHKGYTWNGELFKLW
jgi:hypothetical protein